MIRMNWPYTIVVKYCTSYAKLPCPSGEGTPFAYTILVACAPQLRLWAYIEKRNTYNTLMKSYLILWQFSKARCGLRRVIISANYSWSKCHGFEFCFRGIIDRYTFRYWCFRTYSGGWTCVEEVDMYKSPCCRWRGCPEACQSLISDDYMYVP